MTIQKNDAVFQASFLSISYALADCPARFRSNSLR